MFGGLKTEMLAVTLALSLSQPNLPIGFREAVATMVEWGMVGPKGGVLREAVLEDRYSPGGPPAGSIVWVMNDGRFVSLVGVELPVSAVGRPVSVDEWIKSESNPSSKNRSASLFALSAAVMYCAGEVHAADVLLKKARVPGSGADNRELLLPLQHHRAVPEEQLDQLTTQPQKNDYLCVMASELWTALYSKSRQCFLKEDWRGAFQVGSSFSIDELADAGKVGKEWRAHFLDLRRDSQRRMSAAKRVPLSGDQLAQLPIDQKIDELVWQLEFERSRHPGLERDGPLTQLSGLGYAAVPKLLDTLANDERLSLSYATESLRRLSSDPPPPPTRVADLAERALRQILGRDGIRSTEDRAERVRRWKACWEQVQAKGQS